MLFSSIIFPYCLMVYLQDSIYQVNTEIIERLFSLNGSSPFQNPHAIQARFFSMPRKDFACFSFCNEKSELEVVVAFERMDNQLWRCFILSDGFLTAEGVSHSILFDCLEMVVERLDGATLYFPYIDSRSRYFPFFLSLEKSLSLQRLPSPIIQWKEGSELFIERIKRKSKKRAQRFWNKFERQLTLKELEGEKGISALDLIEKNSWKHKTCQSMHYRDKQFAFYSNWLKRGGLFMHVAVDEHKPVAYILSSKVGHTLYAIKYSYDINYRAYSPGYYLLTKGSYTFWQEKGIETIDLWGSPDTLKNSIKSQEYARFDFVWPLGQLGKHLLEERKNHDTMLRQALDQNQGLRKIYEQS